MATAIERKSVFWYIILRFIIITSLLVSAFVIQVSVSGFLPITPFYYLVLSAYILSILYVLLYSWGRYFAFQAALQVVLDLALITAFVYISGGISTPTYVLYVFPVIGASLVIGARAGYLAAGLAAVLFGLLVDGTYFGIVPYFRADQVIDLSLGGVIYTMFLAWSAFFAIAALVNYFAANLRRTKDALRRAQKELILKERLAEAGRVSAGLAHEIRNPLAAVSGAVQVLKDELWLKAEQKELMDIILRESQRVSQSIEQFLDFAAPGRKPFMEIHLPALLDETLKMIRASGELNGRVRVAGGYLGSDLRFFGNPGQFKQIFWNIVKNAVKAMPEGGTLTIDFETDRREVRMRFADSGVGMTEEDRKHLFEPFYSGFRNGGRGLGMSTVRRIVDDYEGRIEVRSERGKGTEILIRLPVRKAPPHLSTDANEQGMPISDGR